MLSVKPLIVLLAAMATTVNAVGKCCIDASCAGCGTEFSGSFEECKRQGYGAFMGPAPEEREECMSTSEPKRVFCCYRSNSISDSADNGCSDCESRSSLGECGARGYYFDADNTKMCLANGGVVDDPHVKTWNGQWFDYQGECDLVMLHAPEFVIGLDLDIHIRTTVRYDYSFISSAVLRIGNDTMEVASYGQYALNRVDSADLTQEKIAHVAGFPVRHFTPNKKQNVFEVTINSHEKIVLSSFKDLVSVKVEGGASDHYGKSIGLMGSFDGKRLSRDGVTEMEDMNAFGQEWQVAVDEDMLFRTVRAPQAANKELCKLPKISQADKRRRLGETMAQEKAEIACSKLSGVQFMNCVFDVMAVGDIDIAGAGAF